MAYENVISQMSRDVPRIWLLTIKEILKPMQFKFPIGGVFLFVVGNGVHLLRRGCCLALEISARFSQLLEWRGTDLSRLSGIYTAESRLSVTEWHRSHYLSAHS